MKRVNVNHGMVRQEIVFTFVYGIVSKLMFATSFDCSRLDRKT